MLPRLQVFYAATMRAGRAFEQLDQGMRVALTTAWESHRAGSLTPTAHMTNPSVGEMWAPMLPTVTDLAREVIDVFDDARSVIEAADLVWDQLGACVDEVSNLAGGAGAPALT